MAAFKKFITGGVTITPWIGDLGLTVLRVCTGLAMAIAHGWGKIPPSEGFINGTANMGFPAPALFSWLAAGGEFLGGILLAVGLATRPAAVWVLSVMAVAFFIAHADDDFATKEKAFLFGLIALAFAFVGSGRYSLDRFLR